MPRMMQDTPENIALAVTRAAAKGGWARKRGYKAEARGWLVQGDCGNAWLTISLININN